MDSPFSPKEDKHLILLLTYAATVIGSGQFLIQFLDPSLTQSQRWVAVLFGLILAGIFIAVNLVVWKWKNDGKPK